jgi:hypothetical protein
MRAADLFLSSLPEYQVGRGECRMSTKIMFALESAG